MSEVIVLPRFRGRAGWCKHYNGLVNESCDAGVKYADVRKDHEPIAVQYVGEKGVGQATVSYPCFRDDNVGGATCEKCQFRTKEEIAQEQVAMEERMGRLGKAREAIVSHCGGPWKKGQGGSAGVIECPNCQGKLHFSRASYNGHIHAKCETVGCCSWME